MPALEFRYSNFLHHGFYAKVELKMLEISGTFEAWRNNFRLVL